MRVFVKLVSYYFCVSIYGYCGLGQGCHDTSDWIQGMTAEEKYIMLIDAAYKAADKETYYKYMQKADEVLKRQKLADDSSEPQSA